MFPFVCFVEKIQTKHRLETKFIPTKTNHPFETTFPNCPPQKKNDASEICLFSHSYLFLPQKINHTKPKTNHQPTILQIFLSFCPNDLTSSLQNPPPPPPPKKSTPKSAPTHINHLTTCPKPKNKLSTFSQYLCVCVCVSVCFLPFQLFCFFRCAIFIYRFVVCKSISSQYIYINCIR